ncbi:protein takeout-like [Lycorma delicatula]|uniref:protein takeout-like n=1 Tax=Lycorma delicatula TaxID=130591 RepID=UPI003F514FDA
MSLFWERLPEPVILLTIIFIIGICQQNVSTKELPTYVPICKRTDRNLNECFKKATMIIRPYITKGIPELQIPAIDPLMIPMVMLEQGTQAVNYKAKLRNLKVYGLRNYQFNDVKLDLNKLTIQGKITVPMISLESDYEIKGRALVVPIQGMGIFKANLTDVKSDIMIEVKVVKKRGDEYLEPKKINTKFTIGNAMANFDNLFNGDEKLSKATNSFLNGNSKDIVDEIKPAIETLIAMLAEDIGSKVFDSTPYSKLFPK